MRFPIFLSVALATFAASALFAADDGWVQDMEKAQAQAAKDGKDLLMDFTGSDWCGWCIRLNKEVFTQEEFKENAPKNFILVELDFPNDKSKLTPEIIAQNEEWQNKLGVQGFPTIFLADAQGRPYAQTGYQAGGPEKYVAHLEELREIHAKRDEAFLKAAQATGVDRARFLHQGISAMEGNFIIRAYKPEIEEIIQLDSEDTLKVVSLYKAQLDEEIARELKQGYFTRIQEAFEGGKPEEAIAVVDEAIANDKTPKALRDEMKLVKVSVLRSSNKTDEALKVIDELVTDKELDSSTAVNLWMSKATILRDQGKIDESVSAIESAMDNAEDKQLLLQLTFAKAQTLGRSKDHREAAIKAFNEALQYADNDPDLRKFIEDQKARLEETEKEEKEDEEKDE